MPVRPEETLYYKRSRFTSRLPVKWMYSPSHYWLREIEPQVWQVGLTKFAARMLGDLVEHGFDASPGQAVVIGEKIGWLEGFKAISDVYCATPGEFLGGNPALDRELTLVETDLYDAGWLYSVRGQGASGLLDVHGYSALLDATIDKMLQAQNQGTDQCQKPSTS